MNNPNVEAILFKKNDWNIKDATQKICVAGDMADFIRERGTVTHQELCKEYQEYSSQFITAVCRKLITANLISKEKKATGAALVGSEGYIDRRTRRWNDKPFAVIVYTVTYKWVG